MSGLGTVPMTKGLGWKDLGLALKERIGRHHVMAFAGNMAFRVFMAIFPLFVLLLSLLGAFQATGLVTEGLESLRNVLPGAAIELIGTQLRDITEANATPTAFTFGAILSLLLALFGLSGLVRAAMDAFNVMYGVEETRGLVKRYGLSLLLALGGAVLLLTALTLIVVGPALAGSIGDAVGLGDGLVLAWSILRWPALAVVLLAALALFYYYAPNVEQELKFVTPGALIVLALWVGFSIAFSLYVNNFGSYNATYGAFAGLVIFLLYTLYTAVIILLGAEINDVVDEHTEGNNIRQADPGEAQVKRDERREIDAKDEDAGSGAGKSGDTPSRA